MIRPAIQRLADLTAKLGGEVRVVTRKIMWEVKDAPASSEGPFATTCLDYGSRVIWVTPNVNASQLVHEMGHVFGSKHHPEDLRRCNEWEWFGWEVAAARLARVETEWTKHLTYVVGGEDWDGAYWSHLTRRDRDRIKEKRLAHAKRIGIVSRRGIPNASARAL